jgi:hypothetical protein
MADDRPDRGLVGRLEQHRPQPRIRSLQTRHHAVASAHGRECGSIDVQRPGTPLAAGFRVETSGASLPEMDWKRFLWLATGAIVIAALVIWVAAGVFENLKWVRVADLERLRDADVIYRPQLKVFVVAHDRSALALSASSPHRPDLGGTRSLL